MDSAYCEDLNEYYENSNPEPREDIDPYERVSDKFYEKIQRAVKEDIPRVLYCAPLDENETPIDNIDEVCVEGEISFVIFDFITRKFTDPTWLDLCVIIHRISKNFNLPRTLLLESIEIEKGYALVNLEI